MDNKNQINKYKLQFENIRRAFLNLKDEFNSMKLNSVSAIEINNQLAQLSYDADKIYSMLSFLSVDETEDFLLNFKSLQITYAEIIHSSNKHPEELYKEDENYLKNAYRSLKDKITKVEFTKQLSEESRKRREENEILRLQTIQYEEQLQSIKKELDDQRKLSVEDAKEINSIRNSLVDTFNTFEERYKPLLEKQEILASRDIFKKDGDEFLKQGRWWLYATIGAALLLIATVLCFLFCFCTNISCYHHNANFLRQSCPDCIGNYFYFDLISKILLRCLLLSIEIYILTFTAKSYFAARHNHTINTHKANALAAVVNLLGYVSSRSEKEELMKHAANAIFSHQRTGYLSKDGKISQNFLEAVLSNMKSS